MFEKIKVAASRHAQYNFTLLLCQFLFRKLSTGMAQMGKPSEMYTWKLLPKLHSNYVIIYGNVLLAQLNTEKTAIVK